jgi:hypothetical protein
MRVSSRIFYFKGLSMSGNFVLWDITGDEADEIQTLSGQGWGALVHKQGEPLNGKDPSKGVFAGWNAAADTLLTNSIATNVLPNPRDTIPPHNYLAFTGIGADNSSELTKMKDRLSELINTAKKHSLTSWVSRLKLIKDTKGGWSVKNPSKEILDAMNKGDHAGALLEAIKIGGVSLEIYRVDGFKVGDHRLTITKHMKENNYNWLRASEFHEA